MGLLHDTNNIRLVCNSLIKPYIMKGGKFDVTRLKVENLTKNYHTLSGETEALKDISFEVNEGEFISIVGPSGCGKSTILNIIAKLIDKSSGKITLNGEEIKKGTDKIGYMFQNDNLFDWLTVWENVTLGLKIKKCMNRINLIKVENLLRSYQLYDFKDSYPRELSGGMRQRVALIRTLSVDPSILLLDEPFSALDYQTRLMVNDDVYKVIKNENKSVILVTHDISEAIAMGDKVAVLSKRPSTIKNTYDIDLDLGSSKTPFKSRKVPAFQTYFDLLWKELDNNEF